MIEPMMLVALAADDFKKILGDNLVGVYAHGSMAFGCAKSAASDVDFLAVVRREIDQFDKEALLRVLMGLEREAPKRGFEMSVLRYATCQNFVHPAPYDLHYSEKYRAEAARDLPDFCRRMHGTDRDLAAHVTVARNFGLTLSGPPAKEVFAGVPASAYLDSLLYDLDSALEDVYEEPVSVILNFCRVLAYCESGQILSKPQGGRWALDNADPRWYALIHEALRCRYAEEEMEAPDEVLNFCRAMRMRIDIAAASLARRADSIA